MFDLAKTLGIYTDERYDRIKKAIGSFRVEGDFYLVPAREGKILTARQQFCQRAFVGGGLCSSFASRSQNQ